MRNFLFLFVTLITFSLNAQIYIRTNLVGYRPSDHKSAIAFTDLDLSGEFQVMDASGQKVFSGPILTSKAPGYGPFKNYYDLDFSRLTAAGQYQLVIPGQLQATSAAFHINPGIYKNLPDVLLEFMRQQRCGYNPFFDHVCHQKDGRVMDGPMPDSTYIDVTGGWHDAGDQLKYLITGSNATARMIMAYQHFPLVFQDNFNALGQAGANKIPDVLDEAKWGLDWILRLHSAPGHLIHMVADDRDHVGWKLPMYDPSNFGWGKDSYRVAYFATGKPQGLGKYKSQATGIANVAGRSAAALALGYQVWKQKGYDPAFALNCLQSAEELYLMAKKQPGYQQGNSYGAPYRYNEDTWTDDMEWAAVELYRATRKPSYLADAKNYATQTGELSWIQSDTSAHYQFYPFMNIAHYSLYSLVDPVFKTKLATYYRNGIKQTLKQRADRNAFQHGAPFIWCSNNLLIDLVLQIHLYEKMTGDKQFSAYKLNMRDWLFGRNPWGSSMFMNIPAQGPYPRDVHTSTWAITKKEVPGGLVDGPIYYSTYKKQIGLQLTHADPYAAFQNEYVVFHDDIGDYCTNEPTMDGTACAVFFMALFTE